MAWESVYDDHDPVPIPWTTIHRTYLRYDQLTLLNPSGIVRIKGSGRGKHMEENTLPNLASVEGAGRSGLTASVNAYLVLVYTTESLKSTWVCTQSLGNMSPASA